MCFTFIVWIGEYCESIVSLFVCAIFGSFMIFFPYIIHLHFVCLSFVSIILFLFISVFPYVMMIRSRPKATSQVCHTLHSTCRL